ncbi:MAG: hypothetical protein ACYCYK_13400 [Candidatus Dormibacteria bacterium]
MRIPSTSATRAAERTIHVFDGVARHHVTDHTGNLVQTLPYEPTALQQQFLYLLGVASAWYD